MYTPKRFQSESKQPWYRMLERHAFGLLITVSGEDLFTTHLPYILSDDLQTEYSYCLSTDLDKTSQVLSDEYLLGLSDAGAHLTLLSDAAYTTYLLGRWVRERKQLSIESAVQKMTQAPAEFWGIRGRGLLREGWKADVVLFDPTTVDACKAELAYDLPGGGPRLLPKAKGIETVIVNGAVAVERSEVTGARSGEVVRGGS